MWRSLGVKCKHCGGEIFADRFEWEDRSQWSYIIKCSQCYRRTASHTRLRNAIEEWKDNKEF